MSQSQMEQQFIELETQIKNVSVQIENIESYLNMPWTEEEKEKFGTKERKEEQLRRKEEQLRRKEELLLEQQTVLMKRESEQHIIRMKEEFEGMLYQVMLELHRSRNEETKKVNLQLESIKLSIDKFASSINPLVEDFLRKFMYTNDKATKKERGFEFKKQLIEYYYGFEKPVANVKCMFSGISLPVEVVIGSHLFKSCWSDHCKARLGFENINDPRNGLLLFKPFEYAFDNSHICFLFDAVMEAFSMKIVNKELRELTLKEYIEKETEIDKKKILQTKNEWIHYYQKKRDLKSDEIDSRMEAVDNLAQILDKKFSDFEGTYLQSIPGKKCFGRCLSFQASMARLLAIENGWIKKEEFDSPTMFSELDSKKKNQVIQWLENLHPNVVECDADEVHE
jgi:hypothetical protein